MRLFYRRTCRGSKALRCRRDHLINKKRLRTRTLQVRFDDFKFLPQSGWFIERRDIRCRIRAAICSRDFFSGIGIPNRSRRVLPKAGNDFLINEAADPFCNVCPGKIEQQGNTDRHQHQKNDCRNTSTDIVDNRTRQRVAQNAAGACRQSEIHTAEAEGLKRSGPHQKCAKTDERGELRRIDTIRGGFTALNAPACTQRKNSHHGQTEHEPPSGKTKHAKEQIRRPRPPKAAEIDRRTSR